MAATQIRFGRLVKNVADTILPLHLSADQRNVDIGRVMQVSRRSGYVRAMSTQFSGKVGLVKRWVDYDGQEVYIVLDADGANRET